MMRGLVLWAIWRVASGRVGVRTIRGPVPTVAAQFKRVPPSRNPCSGLAHSLPGHARIRFLSTASLCQALATYEAVANPLAGPAAPARLQTLGLESSCRAIPVG